MLADISSLKKDDARAKESREKTGRSVRTSRVSDDTKSEQSSGYVRGLETKIAALEEENRLLRQRDIMHRVVAMKEATAATAKQQAIQQYQVRRIQPDNCNSHTRNRHTRDRPCHRRSTRGMRPRHQ